MYILKQLFFEISVNSGFRNIYLAASFKVVPPSFEYGLVLLATLIRGGGGGGGSQAQDYGEAIYAKIRHSVSSTFATGCSFSSDFLNSLVGIVNCITYLDVYLYIWEARSIREVYGHRFLFHSF